MCKYIGPGMMAGLEAQCLGPHGGDVLASLT